MTLLMVLLSAIGGYVAVGSVLWAITRREEMVFFWLPVVVVLVALLISRDGRELIRIAINDGKEMRVFDEDDQEGE